MIGGVAHEHRVFRSLKHRKNPPSPSGFPSHVLAKSHEGWKAGLPARICSEVDPWVPTILAIGGGKGGVGKSLLSANLAAKLGDSGLSVLLVDLDVGSSNLHTYFGLPMPQRTLTDFVLKRRFNFSDILSESGIERVTLIAGGHDEAWSDREGYDHRMFSSFWHTLLASRKLYGFDIVILDLGAGSHRLNVDFFTAAHMGIVTVLPEPTSIENAYSFLKATYRRLIDHAGGQLGQSEEATFLTNSLFDVLPGQERSGQSLAVKFRQEAFKYPELCDHVAKSLSGRQVGLVVNQIRSQKDNGIGESMAQICRHYFGFDSRFLGGLPDDEAAWKSLRNRRLMIKDFPHSNLTKKLYDVTAKLLTHLGY